MTDDRIDQRLRELARDYHRPPAVPREELWARIAAERARRGPTPRRAADGSTRSSGPKRAICSRRPG